MEKLKPDEKFKKNSYEEIKKLIEDGDEMQLKETIKTKEDNNNNDDKSSLMYLIEFLIKIKITKYCLYIMETFAPEDILIDNLSFKLNKGSSILILLTVDVSLCFPTAFNVYKPSSGAKG